MQNINILDEEQFSKLLGSTPEDVKDKCGHLLQQFDFRYSVLHGDELKETLLKVIKSIDSEPWTVSGEKRHSDWEKGWSENLTAFKDSNFDVDALVPRYMYKYGVRRLFNNYIRPLDKLFEVNFYTVYRHYLFKKYLESYNSVYEFGCGTGYNLAILAQLFPNKHLKGLDWTQASVDIVNTMAESLSLNFSGHRFDFFKPDYSLKVESDSAFITFNSMEQLGDKFDQFIDFVLEKKPAICINSEPLLELYQEHELLDYLAVKYHRKRKYLSGYLAKLRKLESSGEIKILFEQRVSSGNLFHEGYSLVMWEVTL